MRFFLALVMLSFFVAAGAADSLVSLPGASETAEVCTKIETTSGDAGWWCSREFLFPDGRLVRVELLRGRGAGSWTPPEVAAGTEGPLGSGGVCRAIQVGERPALLEWHPLLGSSLVIGLQGDGTLTLESKRMASGDLIPLAQHLLKHLSMPEEK